MQLLALSDIHMHLLNLKKIIEKVDKKAIDAVLIAGDLTNYGSKEQTLEILSMLDFASVFAVPGNLDNADVLEALEEKNASVHASCKEFKGLKICGFGGGLLFNPGDFLHAEQEIEETLSKLDFENGILLTHMPAKGLKIAKTFSGADLGSKAIRKAILEKKPKIAVCGHVHEASGIENLGSTICINVASIKDGRAAIIELDEEVKVKWLKA